MHPVVLVYRFVLHTLAGVFLFSLIGGVAVLLNYGTVLIERLGISWYAMLAVRGLETFLFVVDFLCIVVFVGAETWTFLRDVLRSVSGGRHE
jgi:hypothetical protein